MVAKWKGTVAAALTWAGLALGQQPASAPTTLECPRVITVQELGKKPQRCRVLKTWREADGMVAFEVQVISTGERMTVVESGAISDRAGSKPGSHMQAMTTRIYHWAGGVSPPAGAPLPPATAVARTEPAAPVAGPGTSYNAGQYQNWPTPIASPYTVVVPQAPQAAAGAAALRETASGKQVALSTAPASRQKPVTETAPPSDWHQSWGRAEDHRASLPKTELPHADSSRPDPLKDPENYSRRAVSGVNSAKQETARKEEKKQTPPPAKEAVVQTTSVQPASVQLAGAQPAAELVAPKPEPKPAAIPLPATAAAQPVIDGSWHLPRTAEGERLYEAHKDPVKIIQDSPTLVSVFQRLFVNAPRTDVDKAPVAPPVVAKFPLPPKETETVVKQTPVPPKEAETVVVEQKPAKESVVKAPRPKKPSTKTKTAATRTAKATPVQVKGDQQEVVMVTPALPAGAAVTSQPVAVEEPMMPGSASVLAAGGEPGEIMFMPVPFITLPPLTNPQAFMPRPPPQAQPKPELPPESMNAFTTVEPPANTAAQLLPEAMNAFNSPPEGGQPAAFMPPPMGMYTVSPSGRNFPGYSPGVNPHMYVANPYAAPGTGGFPYGHPQTMNAAPMMVAQAAAPVAYDGRTNTLLERGASAALPRGAAQSAADIPQVIATLRTSLYPSHREWAADNLAAVDWHKHPEVLDALVQAARQDPAATVRSACVHCLGKMNANTRAVTDALQVLKTDASPLVVQEVDFTLVRFSTASTPAKRK